MTPEVALACCRFAHDAATMLLWGAFSYLAVLVPDGLGRDCSRRLAPFRIGAVVLAVATTGLALPIETATVGDGWSAALEPGTLWAILTETSLGRAWIAQSVAACGLVVATLLPDRRRSAATALSAGIMLSALALTGHAAMQEGWLGAVHRLNDAIHLLAGGAWLGALVPLLLVLMASDRDPWRGQAVAALRRFSTAGQAAVALVIATGLINTALTLGRWPTDWSSPYQALLALKIGLVGLMAGLALFNRYGLVPRLAERRSASLKALKTATVAEVGLGVAVIACVSVFGLLDPS